MCARCDVCVLGGGGGMEAERVCRVTPHGPFRSALCSAAGGLRSGHNRPPEPAGASGNRPLEWWPSQGIAVVAVRGSVVLCTDSGPTRMPLLSAGRTYSAGKGAGGGGALAVALCALCTPRALMSVGIYVAEIETNPQNGEPSRWDSGSQEDVVLGPW